MRPERLTLRNIGPFLGTHTVNFAELGDMFLIYGKTGAGKSTLFDALSYAFYGEVPGGRKGLARSMRSQFAEDSAESAVELEFTLACRRYRIRRVLPQERVGVRTGKLQLIPEQSTLEEWSDGAWKDRSSTNKSETDRKILDIIGLSEDEFTRIVLLPQGEFARFLRQNSTERKAVLAKLFPVDRYGRVTVLARERAKEAALLLSQTENALRDLALRFNYAEYDTRRAEAEEAGARLREEQTSLRRDLAVKTAVLEQARAAGAKRQELAREQSALAGMESRRAEIDARRATLDAARKADPLRVHSDQLAELSASRGRLAADLSALEKDHAVASAELAALESKSAETASLEAERNALHVRKERLRIARDIAAELEAETAEQAEISARKAALSKELAALRRDAKQRAERLAELKPEIDALETRMRDAARLRDALERERQLKILADDYDRERKAADAHSGAASHGRAELGTNERDTTIAKAELADLLAADESARKRELAAGLAESLSDGEPCPVCGSTHHPTPATRAGAAAFDTAERISAAERRIESLDSAAARLQREIAAREASLADAGDRMSGIIARFCAAVNADGDASCVAPSAIPAPDEAARRLQEASRVMNLATEAQGRARTAHREAEELRKTDTENAGCLQTLSDEAAKLDLRIAELRTSIGHKEGRYREAFPGNDAMPDPAEAADAYDACSARILEIDAEINTRADRLKDARNRETGLAARKAQTAQSLAESAARLAEAETRFEAACREAGFANAQEARAAARTQEEQSDLEAGIASYTAELSAARGRVETLTRETALWTGPTAEAAASEIASLDGRIAANDVKLAEHASSLAALESLKNRRDELEAERVERASSSGRLAALADDLTGANPQKISFDAWILGMYLEEITAYANTRLERMSEGRYRIQLNDSYRRGNSQTGLDLEICDAYTGRSRPSGTLSGGETFMTSISLALGLADSIQSRSGGIQLDAVFIDEGFGSLDESSLERAINILDEIRGHRMVGLISHVAELRTRIPNRIEILKTGAGSSIRKESHND